MANYLQLAPTTVHKPDNLPFELRDVTINGGDGIPLAGWYVPSDNGAAIIFLHGYGSNRSQLLFQAGTLINAGYGALLVDLRGHGESGGMRRSFGWEDLGDIPGILDFLRNQPDVDPDRIGIVGFSVGGQIALRATAQFPEIQAVFVEGPAPATVEDLPPPTRWYQWLIVPFYDLGGRWMAHRLDILVPDPVIEIIGEIAPRPIMLVATGQNPVFPGGEIALARHYRDAAGTNARLLEIPEAGHGGGPGARPTEYAQRLIVFFDDALAIETELTVEGEESDA